MIDAIVFDAYGTVFDVESVAAACETACPGHGSQVSQIWRQKQLEYTWLRTVMGRYSDFEQVNREALTCAIQQTRVTVNEQHGLEPLLRAYRELTPHPEVPQALRALRGLPRAILSNGTQGMLDAVVRRAQLEEAFARILSVDDLATYKPDPAVYQSAVTALEVPRDRILFVSSNGWDVAGAKAFGFQVAWVNRRRQPLDAIGGPPDYEVTDLLALVEALPR